MTGKEVLKAMIDGLENPETKIDFWSYGHVDKGICYGCAATNAICKIGGVSGEVYVPQRDNMWIDQIPFLSLNATIKTIDDFELAIDYLRQGALDIYNDKVKRIGFGNLQLPENFMLLPELNGYNYKETLHFYKEYYEAI